MTLGNNKGSFVEPFVYHSNQDIEILQMIDIENPFDITNLNNKEKL